MDHLRVRSKIPCWFCEACAELETESSLRFRGDRMSATHVLLSGLRNTFTVPARRESAPSAGQSVDATV
jgi:hypothetical protein